MAEFLDLKRGDLIIYGQTGVVDGLSGAKRAVKKIAGSTLYVFPVNDGQLGKDVRTVSPSDRFLVGAIVFPGFFTELELTMAES